VGSVLVLRASGLGDLLTALPALRAIRARFKDDPVVLATPGWLAELALHTGAIDAVVETGALTDAPPPGMDVDVAINLHGRGPQSHRWLLSTSPRRLVAFRHDEVPESSGGPPWLDAADEPGSSAGPPWLGFVDEPERERWCRLLRHAEIEADADDYVLDPPARSRHAALFPASPVAVVHPGAKDAARRWPDDRWVEVVRSLRARGYVVAITGSASERGAANRIAKRAAVDGVHCLAGLTNVMELADVVARADLVCCCDTGVAHLASAFERPSVVLFGPSSPSVWGPPRRARHVVLWRGDIGDPHSTATFPGLLAIEVDDVLAAVDALGSLV
jgi:ADP-heptose:LPS heptosyltransferase